MKAIKIILGIVVLATIGFCVWKFLGKTPPPINPLELTANPWVKDIKHEIDSVLSDQTGFINTRKYSADIQAHIDDNYKNKHLCNNDNEEASNETNRRLLSERLYASYFKKFVEMTFNVFKYSEWKPDDLKFIREEIKRLQSSSYFDGKGYQGKSIKEIGDIFKKYDDIVRFISTCKSFSYSASGLSDPFPISDIQDNISQAIAYRNNRLGDEYVNNCTRLHDGLKEIPQVLFQAHVRYLDRKISKWSGLYSNYNSYNDYVNNLYTSLKNEINVLKNNIYDVANFSSEYNRLMSKLDIDNQDASIFFSNRK
jgi:hypothetical protein